MSTFAAQITYYIDRFRQGDVDGAFHGLIELDHNALRELTAAFQAESQTAIRVFLLKVIWQRRQECVVPLLAHALTDAEPAVWREALDGLVSVASPAALDVLRKARTRPMTQVQAGEEYQAWLKEAIEQVEAR